MKLTTNITILQLQTNYYLVVAIFLISVIHENNMNLILDIIEQQENQRMT